MKFDQEDMCYKCPTCGHASTVMFDNNYVYQSNIIKLLDQLQLVLVGRAGRLDKKTVDKFIAFNHGKDMTELTDDKKIKWIVDLLDKEKYKGKLILNDNACNKIKNTLKTHNLCDTKNLSNFNIRRLLIKYKYVG
jgi:hypothetical protein